MSTASSVRAALGVAALLGVTVVALPTSQAQQVPPAPDDRAVAAADALVHSRPAMLRAGRYDEYVRHPVITAPEGLQYVPYDRTYRGLPVVGGDFVVATDATGKVLGTSVAQPAPIELASLTPAVGQDAARRTARKALTRADEVGGARLVVDALDGNKLAWEVVVGGLLDGEPSRLRVIVDAATANVLRTIETTAAGTGTGIWNGAGLSFGTTRSGGGYTMADPARPSLRCADYGNDQVFSGPDDTWGSSSKTDKEAGCVDVMYTAAGEWDMLKSWYGRNGLDGQGSWADAEVGLGDVNAYWGHSSNPDGVVFGYNSANNWITAVDVVAHEYGHGLDAKTPGGISGHPSQESVADIWGSLTEHYLNNPNDPPDYEIGEKVNLSGSGPIRYMYQPSKVSGHPDCYSTSLPSSVHAAAGPMNHWFYLLAEGSSPGGGKPNSPTCNSSTLTGIGHQQAGKIFYHAMLTKTSGMTYPRWRVNTLTAAKNLDPTCAQFGKVKAAWDAVSLGAQSGEPTCTPTGDTQPPTAPADPRVTGSTANSVSLAWDASTDDIGVTGYEIFRDGTLAKTVGTTSGTVDGLAADTSYSFTVKAKDAAGNRSAASAAVTGRTSGGGDGGVVNGGFETGSLSGWVTAGTTSLVTSGAHGGAGAARTGATTPTNGDSTIAQTFTVPAGSGQLSFWYSVSCPDTVTYAWARATLKDNTTGTTVTVLPKTCTDGQGWKQVTAPVAPGHDYTLTLVNHDDNYPSDPVSTLYDDVALLS